MRGGEARQKKGDSGEIQGKKRDASPDEEKHLLRLWKTIGHGGFLRKKQETRDETRKREDTEGSSEETLASEADGSQGEKIEFLTKNAC